MAPQKLPAADGSFDAGAVSVVFCSVHDQAQALAELRRVIRPGGELRLYENVRAQHQLAARGQSAFDLIWPLIGGGCHRQPRHAQSPQTGRLRNRELRAVPVQAVPALAANRAAHPRHRTAADDTVTAGARRALDVERPANSLLDCGRDGSSCVDGKVAGGP
jgi:hypothetical protein